MLIEGGSACGPSEPRGPQRGSRVGVAVPEGSAANGGARERERVGVGPHAH